MIQFHYQTFGNRENQPILFLHGFLGSSDDWQSIVHALKEKYHCLVIDLPGHGDTKVHDAEHYRMEQTADSIIRLLDTLLISRCHVCGYSMGGRLAFYLAVHYPERFDKIVIESSSPGLKTEEEQSERRTKDTLLAKRLRMEPFDQFLDDWYELPLFQTINKSSDSFQQMMKRRLKNDPDTLALSLQYLGTGSQPSLWMKLDWIEADLLLITGALDEKYCTIAEDIRSLRPKVLHTVIDGAGHNVHVEMEPEFINKVKEFLNK